MILSRLALKNFRAHRNTTLNFSETLNYIVGGNGQGKTSILEAAYYLCTTKSFNSKDIEAVTFDENEFEINGNFKDLTEDDTKIYFSVPENRKYYFQNNKLISRASQQTEAELDAWSEKLVESGVEIILHRKSFLEKYSEYIKTSYNKIVDTKEEPTIEHFYLDGSDALDIKTNFTKLLVDKKEEEIRRTLNLVGPHKDDFIFYINKINLRTYGSQGQHKTFQAALRFAEFFYLKDTTGKTPIFLLDDVFGELDAYRAGKISKYLKEVGQAFITLTDFANFSFLSKEENDLIIKLENGNITYAWWI